MRRCVCKLQVCCFDILLPFKLLVHRNPALCENSESLLGCLKAQGEHTGNIPFGDVYFFAYKF